MNTDKYALVKSFGVSKITPVRSKNWTITVSVFLSTLQQTALLLKKFRLRLYCYTLSYIYVNIYIYINIYTHVNITIHTHTHTHTHTYTSRTRIHLRLVHVRGVGIRKTIYEGIGYCKRNTQIILHMLALFTHSPICIYTYVYIYMYIYVYIYIYIYIHIYMHAYVSNCVCENNHMIIGISEMI